MSSQPTNPERRGGHAPSPARRDRPEQNIGYDEAAKGAPLTPAERDEAVADSPLTDDDGRRRDPRADDEGRSRDDAAADT